MWPIVLTYVGTMLIAFDIIKRFQNLQVLAALLIIWPISRFMNEFPITERGRRSFQQRKYKYSQAALVLLVCILIVLFLIPLIILSYTVIALIWLPDKFNRKVNSLFSSAISRHYPLLIKYVYLFRKQKKTVCTHP